MIFTEKEAGKLVCPMMRSAAGGGSCVGSKCMAWKWVPNGSLFEPKAEMNGCCGMANPSAMDYPE